MAETWLRVNRRVLAFGLAVQAGFLLFGAVGALLAQNDTLRYAAVGVAAAAFAGCVLTVLQMRRPRIAFADRKLVLNVRRGSPDQIPIEIVEGFLLGQGPTGLDGKQFDHTEARSLVIRLAEKAEDWAQRDVDPSLAKWCGGYITLRGAWCEPLNVEVVQRLNQQLYDVHRQEIHRQAGAENGP